MRTTSRFLIPLLISVLLGITSSFGASPFFKDVCASGCAYSSVQAAIDSITSSSANNVYTVFVDSGVVSSDTAITTSAKSYINFVGRGMGVSVVRASSTYFQNVQGGQTSIDFFDLSGSTNITIRGLTIDVLSQDPLIGAQPAGIRTDNTNRILIESSEIQGVLYAAYEVENSAGNLIQIFNSKFRATEIGVNPRGATWHLFSTDIRVIADGRPGASPSIYGLSLLGAAASKNTTVWGSHIHAESLSSSAAAVYAVSSDLPPGSQVSIIGSTLHARVNGDYGATIACYRSTAPSTAGNRQINIVGSDLLYETPTGLTQGTISGLHYLDSQGVTINLTGVTAISLGSGGTTRADLIQQVGGAANLPIVRSVGSKFISAARLGIQPWAVGAASQGSTLNYQKGTAAFPSSNSVSVAFPVSLPDTSYSVGISANAQETVWVMSKTTTGFTLRSSKANSTASVDWTVTR